MIMYSVPVGFVVLLLQARIFGKGIEVCARTTVVSIYKVMIFSILLTVGSCCYLRAGHQLRRTRVMKWDSRHHSTAAVEE